MTPSSLFGLILAMTSCRVAFSASLASYVMHGSDVTEPRPYLASIQAKIYGRWEHLCGGSLLTSKKVLTAGHCLDEFDGKLEHRAILGLLNISEPETKPAGQVIPIASVTKHPEYNSNRFMNNDIGVAVLQEEATLSDNVVGLVTLSPVTATELLGKTTYLDGWGLTNPGGDTATVLQHLDLVVQEPQVCLKQNSRAFIQDQHICALNEDRPVKDTCPADSGTPLMLAGEQVGLLSMGYGRHCGNGLPSHYVSVAYYLKWIEEEKNLP